MGKILALIENNIATTLLLSSHLTALGYEFTLASGLTDFAERIATQPFDWIILDEAAVRPVWRRLVGVLARHGSAARLVWFGKPLQTSSVRLDAVFEKPLRYAEIARFFSAEAPPAAEGGASEPLASPKGRLQASRKG